MGSNLMEVADRLTEAKKLYSQGLELLKQDSYWAATDVFARAAKLGDPRAQCHLGSLYENGFFGESDYVEAVKWYRKAAGQGLAHGQFRLGACYQLGKGVDRDWEEAARLFELAAKMGHADAAQCLASLREMGVTPPMPDLPPELNEPVTDAIAAYLAQAMQNHAPSQLRLGLAYHLGRNAPLNPQLACFWVMRAMLAGDYDAAKYLPYCTRTLPAEQHGPLQSKIFRWAPGQPVPEL
jgi:hypothetical protein